MGARAASWLWPRHPALDSPIPASCVGCDPDLWFPETNGSGIIAKTICAGCPVLTACRQWALDINAANLYGIWGALDQDQRLAAQGRAANPDRPVRLMPTGGARHGCPSEAQHRRHRAAGEQCSPCAELMEAIWLERRERRRAQNRKDRERHLAKVGAA